MICDQLRSIGDFEGNAGRIWFCPDSEIALNCAAASSSTVEFETCESLPAYPPLSEEISELK